MSLSLFQVTGGNKGLGFGIVRALCKELRENGVVYLASRDEGRGEKAVQELKGEGLNPKFIQLDVCNNDHISKVATYLQDNHGGLDILVNNAGIGFKVPFIGILLCLLCLLMGELALVINLIHVSVTCSL